MPLPKYIKVPIESRLTLIKVTSEFKGLYRCICGNEREFYRRRVEVGLRKSCGCGRGSPIHGQSDKIPEYAIWQAMRQRCLNPNSHEYHRYGGRGITICEQWNSFQNFLADMGYRPSPEYQIERRDNDGNYTPENCYWATRHEQMNNLSTTLYLEHKGKRMSVGNWAEELRMPKSVIVGRFKSGHTVESALYPYRLNGSRRAGAVAGDRY